MNELKDLKVEQALSMPRELIMRVKQISLDQSKPLEKVIQELLNEALDARDDAKIIDNLFSEGAIEDSDLLKERA